MPFLKFRKGKYYIGTGDGEEVPLGRQYWAYCGDWRRGWREWKDDQVVTDLMVRVADDPREPPERDELGSTDESLWEEGLDGGPKDPFSLENQLPVEDAETGERFLFTSSSFGGKIAVEAICKKWATAVRKGLDKGLPKFALAVAEMPTRAYGKVPRPSFVITGWERDDDSGEPIDVTPPPRSRDMNDTIPF